MLHLFQGCNKEHAPMHQPLTTSASLSVTVGYGSSPRICCHFFKTAQLYRASPIQTHHSFTDSCDLNKQQILPATTTDRIVV